MVDISKIRMGDEITVRVLVIGVFVSKPQQHVLIPPWPRPDQIVGHTPAPRPIVVGSRVSTGRALYTVAALAEKEAWLCDTYGYHSTCKLTDLTLADEEPS